MSTMLSPLRNLGWRENYNPLRGLTLAKVLALQEAGERGDYPDLQWLYRAIERSDEVIGTAVAPRPGGGPGDAPAPRLRRTRPPRGRGEGPLRRPRLPHGADAKGLTGTWCGLRIRARGR